MKESTRGLRLVSELRGELRPGIPFKGFVAGTALSLAAWLGLMLLLWILRL